MLLRAHCRPRRRAEPVTVEAQLVGVGHHRAARSTGPKRRRSGSSAGSDARLSFAGVQQPPRRRPPGSRRTRERAHPRRDPSRTRSAPARSAEGRCAVRMRYRPSGRYGKVGLALVLVVLMRPAPPCDGARDQLAGAVAHARDAAVHVAVQVRGEYEVLSPSSATSPRERSPLPDRAAVRPRPAPPTAARPGQPATQQQPGPPLGLRHRVEELVTLAERRQRERRRGHVRALLPVIPQFVLALDAARRRIAQDGCPEPERERIGAAVAGASWEIATSSCQAVPAASSGRSLTRNVSGYRRCRGARSPNAGT